MDYTLISKYLAGEASEEEVKAIFQWIEASPENKKEFVHFKKAWVLTATSTDNQEKVWSNLLTMKKRLTNRQGFFSGYARYAAAVLLVFGLGMTAQYFGSKALHQRLLYASDTKIEVPLGQMSNVVLPDGTTVQLNSGSQLLYSGNYSSGKRTVQLEGEAYFHVSKDKEHPFVVQTQALDFKVYGTSFNVQAYPDDQEVNTTLVEGSLGVINKNGTEFTRLVPGDNIKYQKSSNHYVVSKVNLDLYTSWTNGLITFRNESLKEIAKRLDRWYNVEIIIKNPELENQLYFGTIMKNKPIDQILEVLRLTSNLKYRIVPRPDKPTLIYWE